MSEYGYVRVSARDQNPDRQVIAMKEAGIQEKNIFLDMFSGKDFDRPSYKRLMRVLRPGDHMVIKSIDRLGRNYQEILEQWRFITREKEASIEVLDMPLLNTREEKMGLTGIFIADLVLQILAYVAETERSFIRQRQAEGIEAAKSRGVRFGRKPIEVPESLTDWYYKWSEGHATVREAAQALDISPATFYRRCKELSQSERMLEENCFKG